MPDALFAVLRRLLPRQIAVDVFDPAWYDLAAGARERPRSAAWLALAVLGVWADCWRLALADLPHHLSVAPHHAPTRESDTMFLDDLRHAARRLLREPGFTTAAVLTLALGVGANVAVFAVVEAVLLRPLPYANADELVVLRHRDEPTGITKAFVAIGDYVDLAQRQRVFASFGGYAFGAGTLILPDEPVPVRQLAGTPGFYDAIGLRAALGRSLTADDARDGAAPVVMLGYRLWQQRFAGDSGVIGRSVRLGAIEHQVVGVATPEFRFPASEVTEVILPHPTPAAPPAARKSGWVFAAGRLAPGRTPAAVAADLHAISLQMEAESPSQNRGSRYEAVPLREALVGDTRTALLLLLAAVTAVLLIACANVANLLLARTLARRGELAVRMALGAGRRRLLSQFLAESLVLCGVAGVAGTGLAWWGARALVALVPASVQAPGLSDVRINLWVLAFALALVAATALVFALATALTVRPETSGGVLVAAGRSSLSPRARRAAGLLAAGEVAFAVVLLLGAGLILRSFARLMAVDPGFRTAGVATLEISLPAAAYPTPASRVPLYDRLFADLRAVPGVRDAGAAVVMPLTGNNWTVGFLRAGTVLAAGERPPEVGWQAASGGWFTALGIPLIAGRLFDAREEPESPPVVIISDAVRRRFFGDATAVGQFIQIGDGQAEIVGVVGDIRRAALTDTPREDMYFPFERGPGQSTTLFVRTAGDPAAALGALRAAVRAVDRGIMVRETGTLADVAAESVRTTTLVLWLLGVFAAVALLLAAVGTYGVMAYTVRQRSREFGTRLALGAQPGDILRLVMRQGAVIALAGGGAGLVTGLLATRALRSLLFGVQPTDPLVILTALGALITATLLASWIPARRAAAVDPVVSLSGEI